MDHLGMVGIVVAEDVVVDLVRQVPHIKIHKRIDKGHGPRSDLTIGHMLEVASTSDGLCIATLSLCCPLGSCTTHNFG